MDDKRYNVLSQAARKDRFFTEAEKVQNGALRIKEEIFGRWGLEGLNFGAFIFGGPHRITFRTLDQMAQTLYNLGAASSMEEGKEIMPLFMRENNGKKIEYDYGKAICITELTNGGGAKKYKIEVGWLDCGGHG